MKTCILVLSLIFFSSCSSMKKLAISNSVGVLEEGEKALNNEASYAFIKESALANIKTLEALHYASPEDEELISLLIKGYAGYSFAVLETEAFSDILLERSESEKIQLLKAGYTKAINFGIKYFELNGIKRKDLLSKNGMKLIEENISSPNSSDLKAMFFFAQALAGIFNLEKQNMYLLGSTPLVVGLMENVCGLKPNFENGACDLFQAVFEATKPAIMGGDIEKANKLFKNAFEKSPKNLLNSVTYMQYSLIPMMEEDEAYKVLKDLDKKFVDFDRQNNFGELIKKESSFPKELNLYNAIAKERFEKIKKLKKQLF